MWPVEFSSDIIDDVMGYWRMWPVGVHLCSDAIAGLMESLFMWAIGLCVAIIAGLLIILAFRQWWPIWATCWFCHTKVRIPYRLLNCWDCCHCDQYNGFTENGDYNKAIPAMYEESSTRFTALRPRYSPPPSDVASLDTRNGLCTKCNENQSLKIRQLANFTPSCEETFDEELNAFRRRLEQIYALCSNCQRSVRTELNYQTRKFGDNNKGDTRGKASSRRNDGSGIDFGMNGCARSPTKRRQRRDSASPGRVGNMLSALSLGRSDGKNRQKSTSPSFGSGPVFTTSNFTSSSPSSTSSHNFVSSFYNDPSCILWPSRLTGVQSTNPMDNDDVVSVFSSISQKHYRNAQVRDQVNCSYHSPPPTTDWFWRVAVSLVLVCSFSTNAVVLYFLLIRG